MGHGSRFIVELPLEPDDAEAAPAAPVAAPVKTTSRGRRILVIEDNEDAALTTKLILERWGHRVELQREGRDALEAARRLAPELVLCDIGLPGDMDGYAVARAMRADQQLRSIYLIALTGYGTDEDKSLALRAGFDVHMTKPLSAEALMSAVASAPTPD